jgi:hypothetical protein
MSEADHGSDGSNPERLSVITKGRTGTAEETVIDRSR